jgi:hypothetical protein
MKDLAPNHRSSRRRRELSHLLSYEPHLLTVGFVSRETADLIAQDRADASPGSRLPKRRAHRFTVGQSLAPHNLERRDARIIEPDVE